jgi:hypothetical protein
MDAATKQTALVTKDELTELADWERKHSDATKRVTAAEKELKFRRQQLAEKVLGVKSSEDLKKLSPKQVEKRAADRLEAGDWKPERGAPEFQFVKTSQGSYPAWKQEFIKAQGETAANEIAANAPVVYSYSVEVSA